MSTLRDSILGPGDTPREQVDTPEWASKGVHSVYVRGLTSREQEEFEQMFGPRGKRRTSPTIRASLVALTVVDENGERVFDGKADVDALADQPLAVISRLWDKARELSGMETEADRDSINPSEGDQEDADSYGSP